MMANVLPTSIIDNPILGTWVDFEQDGRVRIATGKVELGQGILTAVGGNPGAGGTAGGTGCSDRAGMSTRLLCQPG